MKLRDFVTPFSDDELLNVYRCGLINDDYSCLDCHKTEIELHLLKRDVVACSSIINDDGQLRIAIFVG